MISVLVSKDRIASFNFSKFPFSTTMPQLSLMLSGLPPVLKVITGVPQARASRLVVGKVSSKVGFTKA